MAKTNKGYTLFYPGNKDANIFVAFCFVEKRKKLTINQSRPRRKSKRQIDLASGPIAIKESFPSSFFDGDTSSEPFERKRRRRLVRSDTSDDETSGDDSFIENDEEAEESEGGSFGDFLGCIFAMGSEDPDIIPDSSTSAQLALCTEIDKDGTLSGLVLASAATVEKNIGKRVKPGLYLTNAARYDLDLMVDAEPRLEGLLWEAIDGDDSSLKLFPVSNVYQDYLYAIQQSESDRFDAVVEAIPAITAELAISILASTKPSRTGILSSTPSAPIGRNRSAAEEMRGMQDPTGDDGPGRRPRFGRECASRLVKALPFIKAAEQLSEK